MGALIKRRLRLTPGLIPGLCGILGLAAICAAGFLLWLWLGLVLTGVSLILIGEMIKE
jgi:hypothetical protein